jgi:glutamate dehydrogenase
MSYKFEEEKSGIITAVLARVADLMAAEFIKQFLNSMSLDDLRDWSLDNLYGLCMHLWDFMQLKTEHENKINIYNPELQKDGWHSSHTFIEVLIDDMPFLVDSLRMAINSLDLSLHLSIHMGGVRLLRDANNKISSILPRHEDIRNSLVEAPIVLVIDKQNNVESIESLYQALLAVLEQNSLVVHDWPLMCTKVQDCTTDLQINAKNLPCPTEETLAFLHWIIDQHFIFLGLCDYVVVKDKNTQKLEFVEGSGLGLLRKGSDLLSSSLEWDQNQSLSNLLMVAKTDIMSQVHRSSYIDYILVKRFNESGDVVGERRIIGLYTSSAYNMNPIHIPFLRHKVQSVIKRSALNVRSHAGRVLMNILETLPRDDLIQATDDEILDIAIGIFHMQERRRIRMFARVDSYQKRFVSCLVLVPKDRITTELCEQMADILTKEMQAASVKFTTYFGPSVLARIHFMVYLQTKGSLPVDFRAIEMKLIEAGRSWTDDLQAALLETFGEDKARDIFLQYKNAFPAGYIANLSAKAAVDDMQHIQKISDKHPLVINFHAALDDVQSPFRLKLYRYYDTIPLSDVLPIIENLGLRAISERPYAIKLADVTVWINEFCIDYKDAHNLDVHAAAERIKEAFAKIWFLEAENDRFNKLVLSADLSWRQVVVLRMYAKYLKQIGFVFSQEYIENALQRNFVLARMLVQLFELRFDPKELKSRSQDYDALAASILAALDNVTNLDEDKIIRQFVQTITATLRTNYYQLDSANAVKPYVSIKLLSAMVPGLPKPHPLYEIFVYAPSSEAIHLRASKVARGGLRWSDRREDFRTEVLGLMKAQQVKNAVIVPNGAKGGFVLKRDFLANASREEINADAVFNYQNFIRGLLDITDNYVEGSLKKPEMVICYDDDDPYLVVAADKGTATFSDIANAIAVERNFWLGDAFASGGGNGYDHKKMGITAKGAFESVKRNCYQLGIDVATMPFTVVGIGDMAGDVFGNGMLLSNQIKLLAAFNHMHIFIDPNPDLALSFNERKRMFSLPRSSWDDYDKSLISKGGGVFLRSAKTINLSLEMQKLFGIESQAIEPNELIRVILCGKFDLLWSAGIGTFVKSSNEINSNVGDRTNDAIRVNAKDLRCRAVAEGGNLGFTQLARVEFALQGGIIHTDFIDNSAGVSCSDKEVNIKILLNIIMADLALSTQDRNHLLAEMTDEVASLVLRENYLQTRAISFAVAHSKRLIELHALYINHLVRTGKLDRALEFLPEDKVLRERKLSDRGLTSPEIAVLLCYSKILLKEAILSSDILEEECLQYLLVEYFPKPLQARFADKMPLHTLKREIIATKISNLLVNDAGFSFVHRLQDETGAPISAVVRAAMIARSLLDMDLAWSKIEALDNKIDALVQNNLILIYVRLMRRLSRWLLRNQRTKLDIAAMLKKYSPGFAALKSLDPQLLNEKLQLHYHTKVDFYMTQGLAKDFASELTHADFLFAAMDLVEVSESLRVSVEKVALVYFEIGQFLDLDWLRDKILVHSTDNNWESLTRESLRDDLDWQQRQLTLSILQLSINNAEDFNLCLSNWTNEHAVLIQRWFTVLSDLRSSASFNYTMFSVATRDLLDLTQTTMQVFTNDKH